MPMLNFQKQFAADVESGKKTQTIRSRRKHPIKKGDTLYLYTGARTKACRKLREVRCKDVLDIFIFKDFFAAGQSLYHRNGVLNEFAQLDGFKDWTEMCDWFDKTHGLPFNGDLIKW